jgi:AcrR family transcriptional regulator
MAASPTKTKAPPTPQVERTQRADARRNRERVLSAARAQFAANGLEAQIDDIARAADVGVGTVYRHFPTKEALLEALAADRFIRLAEWAREALEAPDGVCSPRQWRSGMPSRELSAKRTS